LPLPIVAQNSNRSATNSINLTGATKQIASEEQQPAVTAAATTTITPAPPPSPPTTTTTLSASPMVQPCCPSNGYFVNAGPDQTMLEGTMVTLNGSGNNNNNNKSSNVGNTANYLWRQTDGPAVILNGNNTAHPSFVAPNYPDDKKYTFALEVSENQVVNNNNNNNQTGSAIDTVDILVKDINAISKKSGSFQQQVSSTPSNKSESQTQLFRAAQTNGENYDEEDKYDNKSDSSSAVEVTKVKTTTTAATANHKYYQGKEKIEKEKEKEKADTASVIQDKVKGSDDKEDEQEKQESYDDSKHETEEKEESEPQIEKVKEKEKTEDNHHDDSGGSSKSDSDNIDNNIISFSINNNNNNDDTHKENDLFNYDIKVKKFTGEMNQRIENLKDRIEYLLKER
jgi:hypothetical protein